MKDEKEGLEVLSSGSKQSAVLARFDLLSPAGLKRLATVRGLGAIKYPVDNWKGIPVESHLNHALNHIYLFLDGDTEEDHLGHAFCRLMFAVDLNEKERTENKCPTEVQAQPELS